MGVGLFAGYGVSSVGGDGPPDSDVLDLARFQGRRLAAFAEAVSTCQEPVS